MERRNVEAIFTKERSGLLGGSSPSNNPIAIILGGQPACGKSKLLEQAKNDHPDKRFLAVNGDLYRTFHPDWQALIKDTANYSGETQIFSNVFTEGLMNEAIKNKYDIIIEGTMRNPDTPLKTAELFRQAGFRIEAYVIAAPPLVTEIGIYNRFQEEIEAKGFGRLADINSHNDASKNLLRSVDTLFGNNAVDKISIHTFMGQEKVKDFNFDGRKWDCYTRPSDYIVQSRNVQLNNRELLSEFVKRGEKTLQSITQTLKPSVTTAINQLYQALNKIQDASSHLSAGL